MNKLDHIAKEYREDLGFESTLARFKTMSILPHCKGDAALDLGCGVGLLTIELASRFSRVVGVDGSGDKIAAARQFNGAAAIEYVRSYFEDYAPTEKFDTIVMGNILEHLQQPVPLLKRVHDWLSPGGVAIAAVPNARAINKRIGLELGMIQDYYQLTEAEYAKGHYQIFDSDSLRQAFTDAGFTVRHLRGIFLKPLSNSQMEAWDSSVVDALFEVTKGLPNTEEYCSPLLIVAEK